jgi:RNA polymerase sigma-70 factor (ECF subfamily)
MHNVFVNQRALARHERNQVSLDAEDGEAWRIPVRSMQYTRMELIELTQHVGRLPVDQREVLLLAVVEEMRYEEIAAALAIPVGTVMSRLSRAREKLRAAFADGAPSALKIVK